ncbi:MAG TPA: hypothetical protein VMR98_05835 [Candidatus Polarisedimenticolaceae bacterium]|nr:hypothetical protein [Candidatus Polarisedimenticolaceae bacterium]
MKPIKVVDSATQALLFLGTMQYITQGLGKAKRDHKPNNLGKLYLGLLGTAAVYQIGRLVGPKTPEEKRAARLTDIYDQAAGYRKRAELYRRGAEVLLKRGLHNFKSATSK